MTIKDIARECGCSVSTVSRVINEQPGVKKETKEIILKVINERNFVPNVNARNLKSIESENILIVVCGMKNMVFASMVEIIQSEINFYQAYSFVHYLPESEDILYSTKKLLKEIKPKGVIFLGGNILGNENELKDIELPCIFVTTCAQHINKKNIMSIAIDDFYAGKFATEHLLSLNHKKIGVISGNLNTSNASKLRYAGCKKAFKDANISFDEANVVYSKFSYKAAYDATKELLDKLSGLTAIFAMSDVMGIGAISAIVDSGLKVPDDISVMGVDGIEISQFYTPKITTLNQPTEQMAKMAVRRLMESVNYGFRPYYKLLLPELITGNSVKAI